MSAETLRHAAADIRSEWRDDNHTSDGRCKYPKTCVIAETHQLFADGRLALAVADWLEAEASKQTPTSHLAVTFTGEPMFPVDKHALAVARSYLGEPK